MAQSLLEQFAWECAECGAARLYTAQELQAPEDKVLHRLLEQDAPQKLNAKHFALAALCCFHVIVFRANCDYDAQFVPLPEQLNIYGHDTERVRVSEDSIAILVVSAAASYRSRCKALFRTRLPSSQRQHRAATCS